MSKLLFWFILGIFSVQVAIAAGEPKLEVSVDRTAVGKDESISLKFRVITEGVGGSEEPQFQAPDFDVVSQYSSVFVESYFENGKFGARNNRQFTKVLRPNREGELTISGIQLRVGGKTIQHPPLKIQVGAAGRGTPPPPNYGGSGVGLRGAAKHLPGANLPFSIRAEVDQSNVVKGQQIIVSYYLYQRVNAFNIQVEKYPVFDGFLREDLELPILGQRLTDRESVVLDGVAYERLLLARYAAYPLKEGKLFIDSMGIKANYYAPAGGIGNQQDPFNNAFGQLMQQMQPRLWSHRNEPLPIIVEPVPLEGRPASFTGGVGDFEIASAVDRTTVQVNEPVTFTVKVEGRGNIGAIAQPPIKWPPELEIYETKQKVTGLPGGVSTKVFEILTIPRKPGKILIPEIELAYFSPTERTYKVKKANALEISVEGQASEASPKVATGAQQAPAPASTVRPSDGLLLPEQWKSSRWPSSPSARWLVLAMVGLSSAALGGLMLQRLWRIRGTLQSIRQRFGGSRQNLEEDYWQNLKNLVAKSNSLSLEEIRLFYQKAAEGLCIAFEKQFSLPSRAWSRSELRHQLDQLKSNGSIPIENSLWQRIENILEYAEAVQFSGLILESEVRQRMESTLKEVERILAALRDIISRPNTD